MKCPLCQLELRISKSRNVVEMVDDTPHLYYVMDMSCMNEKCDNYEKVVNTIKDEQPLG